MESVNFERVGSDLFRLPFSADQGEKIARARGMGLFSILLPEEHGGMGGAIAPLCEILATVSGRDGGLAAIMATQALAQDIWLAAGSRAGWGEGLTAFPLFECPLDRPPEVRAERFRDSYFLTGHSDFVALGGTAERALIAARVSEGCFAFFLIDRGAPGFSASAPIETLGLDTCPFADLSLNECPAALIGGESSGPALWEHAAARANAAIAAMLLGIMKASLTEAQDFSEERVQGGRKINEWSEHRMVLATMSAQVRAAEMLVAEASRAADEKTEGWRQKTLAAAIQLQETASELTSCGLQALGGSGYMKEHDQERHFRDAHQLRCILGSLPKRKLGLWTS